MLISTPIALGIAIFLSELSPKVLRTPLAFLTELLAAIPSIVYGLWGVFVLVPIVRQLQVITPDWMRKIPLFSGPPLGVGMLAAALILAVMVIPFTSSVAREVLKAVPVHAARGRLRPRGATRWEAILAALRFGRTGIIGAIILGFGRAIGETMAVTMVIGNNPQISASLFKPQYTMAAVIANEFTEAADDLYLSALIEIGLVLFIITLIINALSRLLIWSVTREVKVKAPRPVATMCLLGARGRPREPDGPPEGPLRTRRLPLRRRRRRGARAALLRLRLRARRRASRRSTGTSSRRCPSPSARRAAAWPTRWSARSS